MCEHATVQRVHSNFTWPGTVARPAESSRQDVITRGNESGLSLYLPWKTCQCCSRGTATFSELADRDQQISLQAVLPILSSALREQAGPARPIVDYVVRRAPSFLPFVVGYVGGPVSQRRWIPKLKRAHLCSPLLCSAPGAERSRGEYEQKWLRTGSSGMSMSFTHRPLQHCAGVSPWPVLCKLPRPHDHGSVAALQHFKECHSHLCCRRADEQKRALLYKNF